MASPRGRAPSHRPPRHSVGLAFVRRPRHHVRRHHFDHERQHADSHAPGHRRGCARPADLRARRGDGDARSRDALRRRARRHLDLLLAEPPDSGDGRASRRERDPLRRLLAPRHVPRRHPASRGTAASLHRQRPEAPASRPVAAAHPRPHDVRGPADRARRSADSGRRRGGRRRTQHRLLEAAGSSPLPPTSGPGSRRTIGRRPSSSSDSTRRARARPSITSAESVPRPVSACYHARTQLPTARRPA